ncbi:AGAP004307-PB [Anopheles gambiae str. PEST]|uniref:AGAP004307-PA n=1 Tax=Anopheles gambiae TaxID=7165 RepID=Q7PHF8_ANOGA|nr:AGAP004307-PA [Anopheles gambiae str. PEST]EGK97139.1 AGAP004307-PB [Anopheles gambiae str. PEST]
MATQAWSDGLIHAISNVKKQLFVSDLAVVIKDKYPKALHHFLVLPWKDIDSVYDLSSDDDGLLQNMYELGLKAVGTTGLTVDRFDFGYHMKPSMRRLHLHVISKDYYSPCLSHRYHWNAFNTEFLLKHENVVEKLHEAGHIHRPSLHYIMKLLETPLQCNQCMYNPNNFADLKLHLKQHVESDIESTTS